MKINKYIQLISACFLALSLNAMADISVITSASSDVGSMTSKDVKKIFLGKSSKMNPVDQSEDSDTRNAFYKKVVGKSLSQMTAYWSKMIFSGKAIPPVSSSDDNAIKAWVKSNKKGIGYIDSSALDNSVKVVLTVK